jgi:hypothetical protein
LASHIKGRTQAECSGTGCGGEYVEIGESKWQEDGENNISSSFMIPKIIQKISEQHAWKARHQ